eukprot:Pgem_evm1s8203
MAFLKKGGVNNEDEEKDESDFRNQSITTKVTKSLHCESEVVIFENEEQEENKASIMEPVFQTSNVNIKINCEKLENSYNEATVLVQNADLQSTDKNLKCPTRKRNQKSESSVSSIEFDPDHTPCHTDVFGLPKYSENGKDNHSNKAKHLYKNDMSDIYESSDESSSGIQFYRPTNVDDWELDSDFDYDDQ